MQLKLFYVSFHSNMIGSYDATYVVAENEAKALERAKPMLNTKKLVPNFLNDYGRFHVNEICDV